MTLTEAIKPVLRERALTGLTGGASTDLDGIVTVGLLLSPVPRITIVIAGVSYFYFLRAGTDAEASPSIIRPDDYSGGTNEKVWERIQVGTGDLLASNNLSDVANAAAALSNLGGASDADLTTLEGTVATNTSDILLRLVKSNNLSDLANAGTARTNLGLVIGTNVQAWSANLDSWSAITTASKQAALGFTPLNAASNLSDLNNAGTARINLSLVIGTDVQAWSANLDAWSALATSSKLAAASNLSDLANVSTARTNLGLAIGSNVQAWSANLDAWSALATSTKAAQTDMTTAQADIVNLKKINLPFLIEGGGVAITTGSKGWLRVPAAMTVTKWEIFADVSGSIVVDIKRATYANLPTFTAISASAAPTLSSAQKNTDSTLTGWTTSLAEGDWLEFNVASASTVTRVTVVIIGTRT